MMPGLMGTLRFAHPTRDPLVICRMGKGREAIPIIGLVMGTLVFAHPTRSSLKTNNNHPCVR